MGITLNEGMKQQQPKKRECQPEPLTLNGIMNDMQTAWDLEPKEHNGTRCMIQHAQRDMLNGCECRIEWWPRPNAQETANPAFRKLCRWVHR